MAVIELIAAAEATLLCASHVKRSRMRKQQVLMGNSFRSVSPIPFVDEYLRQRTLGASQFQLMVASKLAVLCRQLVHTRAFEYMLLHAIRTTVFKRTKNRSISDRRITQ